MNFDTIRCYNTSEIPAVLERLANEKQCMHILSTIYPLLPKANLRERLLTLQDADEFQLKMIYPFLKSLEAQLTKGITLRGLERIDTNKSYLYVSNHRDIVMDSALFCAKLLENHLSTVEIAIGDNLLIFPWIEDLVRLNKSFIVRRSPGAKQMLEISQLLSHYIAHTIQHKQQSIWIAQREGRSKDSDDRTQESLLKMLQMSGKGSLAENLAAIRICPLSISYEYDPCDYLKAKEFQLKRDVADYKKSALDDLLHMQTGVMGYKGSVVYTIGGDISNDILQMGKTIVNRNELIKKVAEKIDTLIHAHYQIFNVNKIAYDLLLQSTRFSADYSLSEKLNFEKYVQGQVQKVDIANRDYDFLTEKILLMYANPLVNYLKAHG